MLIAAGCDMDSVNVNGGTLAMHEAAYGHVACLALIIEAGEDLESNDIEGNSAAMLAAGNGWAACVEMISVEIERRALLSETAKGKGCRPVARI